MKVAFACDHGSYDIRKIIIDKIKSLGHEVIDYGSDSDKSVDYPEFGVLAARAVKNGTADRAIVVCKTGIGMCIVANKVKGVRCALCSSVESAKKTRLHNDTNALSISTELVSLEDNLKIIEAWLNTEFSGDERHQRRIDQITKIENEE